MPGSTFGSSTSAAVRRFCTSPHRLVEGVEVVQEPREVVGAVVAHVGEQGDHLLGGDGRSVGRPVPRRAADGRTSSPATPRQTSVHDRRTDEGPRSFS